MTWNLSWVYGALVGILAVAANGCGQTDSTESQPSAFVVAQRQINQIRVANQRADRCDDARQLLHNVEHLRDNEKSEKKDDQLEKAIIREAQDLILDMCGCTRGSRRGNLDAGVSTRKPADATGQDGGVSAMQKRLEALQAADRSADRCDDALNALDAAEKLDRSDDKETDTLPQQEGLEDSLVRTAQDLVLDLCGCQKPQNRADAGSDSGGQSASDDAGFSSGTGDATLAHGGRVQTTLDTVGTLASVSTENFDKGATNGFFANLGTNGRTCGSCHIENQGWTFTPAEASKLSANDPIFTPHDGSDCPPTSPNQKPDKSRSTLVTGYGLIRIQIGIPSTADFRLQYATNPKKCAIPPASALIGGQLFLFRRPLPSTNLAFTSSVMWDDRETLQNLTTGVNLSNTGPLLFDLSDQANTATLGHAQATKSIAGMQVQADIVSFETNLYTAQSRVGGVDLTKGANGGPEYIASTVAPAFFIGQNNPGDKSSFTSTVFTLFAAWEPDANDKFVPGLSPAQQAIGRGEKIFNTRTFKIANVSGINSAANDPLFNPADPLANKPIMGTCSSCHNTPNIGNHSTLQPVNIGVAMDIPQDNDGRSIPNILDAGNLPGYLLRRTACVDTACQVRVTDPGRALISGKWVDIGKTKTPILRGLSARAPYFHNGSAKDLFTVVAFYNARFNMTLTRQESSDLVAFMSAL